jgi:hypothetical protein
MNEEKYIFTLSQCHDDILIIHCYDICAHARFEYDTTIIKGRNYDGGNVENLETTMMKSQKSKESEKS